MPSTFLRQVQRWVLPLAALVVALWPLLQANAATERGPALRVHRTEVEDASQARVIVKYKSGSRLMQALAVGRAAPQPQHATTLS